MDKILEEKVTNEYTEIEHPDFRVGDIIEVHVRIVEEKKERIQIFKGIVISIKGSGTSKMFKVRKISYGVGVERTFPFYSPMIKKIKIIKQGKKVKRSKLYYLRKRVGKIALKAGIQIPAVGENLETKFIEKKKQEEDEKDSEKTTKEKSKDNDKKSKIEKGKEKDKKESKEKKEKDVPKSSK